MKDQPTLEASRILLRRPTQDDSGAIAEIHGFKEVADRLLSVAHPCPEDQGDRWWKKVSQHIEREDLFCWVIVDRDTQQVIGDAELHTTLRQRRGSLGYMLHPDRWGEGLMTETLSTICQYAFESLKPTLNRIDGDHYPENPSSGRVLEKLGAREEGLLRQYVVKEGVPRDLLRWSILREEFRPVNIN